jgi:hypothetical protein
VLVGSTGVLELQPGVGCGLLVAAHQQWLLGTSNSAAA